MERVEYSQSRCIFIWMFPHYISTADSQAGSQWDTLRRSTDKTLGYSLKEAQKLQGGSAQKGRLFWTAFAVIRPSRLGFITHRCPSSFGMIPSNNCRAFKISKRRKTRLRRMAGRQVRKNRYSDTHDAHTVRRPNLYTSRRDFVNADRWTNGCTPLSLYNCKK